MYVSQGFCIIECHMLANLLHVLARLHVTWVPREVWLNVYIEALSASSVYNACCFDVCVAFDGYRGQTRNK